MRLNPADFPESYRLCAVCGRPLDGVLGEYAHLNDHDGGHVPVPVRVGELPFAVMRCDFCSVDIEEGGWVLPASNFMVSAVGESRGNWSVCPGCLPDVRRRRWSALAARTAASPEMEGLGVVSTVRKDMLRLYRRLEVHVTGAPYPAMVVPNPPELGTA